MRALIIAALAAVLAAGPAVSGQESAGEAQQRGRRLYETGVAASGAEIVAVMGAGDVEVPAAVLPCANCHGGDGRGNPEGGVTPADVTWDALTKPYGATRPDGRRRPPYDSGLLARAIRDGLDSGGARLDAAMPRYRMPDAAMADLLAWLEVIGTTSDPGVGEDTLTIGVILPPEDGGGMGAAVRAAVRAYFSEVNRRGGVYGREILLDFLTLPADPGGRAAAVADFIAAKRPFAIGAAFVAGADAEIGDLAEELEVPVVGAVGLYPDTSFPLNRWVFHLYSGLAEQGRALVVYAAQRFPAALRTAAIVHSVDERSRQVATAIEAQLRDEGVADPRRREVADRSVPAAALAAELRAAGTAAVFFVGSGAAAVELLDAGAAIEWTPLLFMAGASAGDEIFSAPPSAGERIFLSFPTFPTDRTDEAMLEYRSLVEAYALPPAHRAMQLTSLAAARLLLEGLSRSGRAVSREKLLGELEALYAFQTGLMPAISYGANRRIGALGAHVVGVSLESHGLGPEVEWVPLR